MKRISFLIVLWAFASPYVAKGIVDVTVHIAEPERLEKYH